MKKIFTILLVISGIYSVAFAQTKNRIEFGGVIGYNSGSVTYSGSNQNSDYIYGLNTGVSMEYYFSRTWGIKGKLLYDQKGWGNGYLIFNDGTEINAVDFHLDYLTIPVMANWHFGRTKNWYLNFGPYWGFLIKSTAFSDIDLKDTFNPVDVGIAFGIGVKFPVSRNVKLFIEAEGQGGFTDIFKDNPDAAVQNVRSSINVGFLIPLK